MKKIFFGAALVLAALNFASCKDNTPACWEVTMVQHMEMMGEKEDITTIQFIYGTEADVDAAVKQLTNTSVNLPGMSVKYDVSKKKADKSESDCVGMMIE